MDVLQQLMADAQGLFREMSRTQRVSFLVLVGSIGVLLTAVVVVGSAETVKESIPVIQIEPSQVAEVKKAFQDAGVEAEYKSDGYIYVDRDKAMDARLVIAELNINPSSAEAVFDEMLKRWSIGTTGPQAREMMRAARGNFIARTIEKLSAVKDATVIYSDDNRATLFSPPSRQSAAVEVTTKLGQELDQKTAETIIGLVAHAKGGLEEQHVVVTDQHGKQFRKRTSGTPWQVAGDALGIETTRMELLRDKIEGLCRAAIPGCRAWAFVDVKMNLDKTRRESIDYGEGSVNRKQSRKIQQEMQKIPGDEVGTRPNVGRAGSAGGGGMRESSTLSDKQADTNYLVDRVTEVTEVAPTVKQVTVSAVVRMPYKYATEKADDGNEKFVYMMTHDGQTAYDDEGRPIRKKVPGPDMTQQQHDDLEQAIQLALGRLTGDKNVEVKVVPVPWPEEIEYPEAQPGNISLLVTTIIDHTTTIIGAIFLAFVVYMAYAQANKALPADELEIPDESPISMSVQPEMSEQDKQNASFEAMRSKLSDMIDENPAKSAALVRRWMTRENF